MAIIFGILAIIAKILAIICFYLCTFAAKD